MFTNQYGSTSTTTSYRLIKARALNLQSKNCTPSNSTQYIRPDSNYDGLSLVTVAPQSGGGSDVDIYREPTKSPSSTPQTRGPDGDLHYCTSIGSVSPTNQTKSIYFIVTVGNDAYYWCINLT